MTTNFVFTECPSCQGPIKESSYKNIWFCASHSNLTGLESPDFHFRGNSSHSYLYMSFLHWTLRIDRETIIIYSFKSFYPDNAYIASWYFKDLNMNDFSLDQLPQLLKMLPTLLIFS